MKQGEREKEKGKREEREGRKGRKERGKEELIISARD